MPRLIYVTVIAILSSLPGQAASLRATTESQEIQNAKADADHLSRMADDQMTERWRRLQLIEPVPPKTGSYYIHEIPPSGRFLRPWAKLFLTRLSAQYRKRFGKPMRITSLLRTAEHQKRLMRSNGNAAEPAGPKRSAHLTGASIDISKKGMTGAERSWIRNVLTHVRDKGHIFAIEEFQQPNFHVLVYRSYQQYVAELTGKR